MTLKVLQQIHSHDFPPQPQTCTRLAIAWVHLGGLCIPLLQQTGEAWPRFSALLACFLQVVLHGTSQKGGVRLIRHCQHLWPDQNGEWVGLLNGTRVLRWLKAPTSHHLPGISGSYVATSHSALRKSQHAVLGGGAAAEQPTLGQCEASHCSPRGSKDRHTEQGGVARTAVECELGLNSQAWPRRVALAMSVVIQLFRSVPSLHISQHGHPGSCHGFISFCCSGTEAFEKHEAASSWQRIA